MGLHDGHRQRKRQQFLSHGPESMADHELLELAPVLCHPPPGYQRDRPPAAGPVRVPGPGAVRPEQELEKVEGVGQGAAVLLRLMGSIGDRARRPGREEKIVASVDQAGAYFLRLLDGQRTERLYQLCVDAKGKVLSCRMLSQGQADMTVLSLRQVVENALLSGASGVFLGHNHPSGVALPSPADMEATTQVRDALKRLDIRLIDHIIVADGDYVSMASSGLLR